MPNAGQNYTLTYDGGSQGFPSFYSYNPDWMIGMNNYFYSFSEGNIYRHNTNATRNQYYGTNYSSTLTSVFNDQPFDNKLFKTLALQGDDSWAATLTSDQQDSGYVESAWFEKKEGSYFAFIRNAGTVPANIDEYALRSLNGLGTSSVVLIVGVVTTISFPTTLFIGNIISVGDMMYFTNGSTPIFAGEVTAVNQNIPAGINDIVIDTTSIATTPVPSQTEYFLYIKNAVAESHGILGHYGVFHLTNTNQSKIELFAVEAEVMKSFP
jgi:hypothetical protein